MTAPVLTTREVGGRERSFSRLAWLRGVSSLDSPADGLEVCLHPGEEVPGELCEMTLRAAGEVLFTGMVDEQERVFSPKGSRLELSGRSWGALLLDNEALPATHQSLTLAQLADRCLAPYGRFGLAIAPGEKLPRFVVPKGISEWEAMGRFCRLTTGSRPWLDEGLILREGPRPLGRKWPRGMLPVEEARWQLRREKVISRVCLRDNYGYYPAAVDLAESLRLGVRRKRYWIPPSLYAGQQGQGADDLLAAAYGQKHRVSLTLAGLWPVRPGEQAAPPEGFAPWPYGVVCRVQWQWDQSGGHTVLELADPAALPWLMG